MTFQHTLVRDDDEIEVTVSYEYHRAHRGARDGRYGPPLEPDEPAYCEIDSVTDEGGNQVELTAEEEDEISLAAWEDHEGMRSSAMEARAEARAQDQYDRDHSY